MVLEQIEFLEQFDPQVGAAIRAEYERQQNNIELIASENIVSEAVLAAAGSVLTNKYAEGYPGKRYYGGCAHVDVVEQLAIDRACELFGAKYANVQPHSGAQANYAVYMALCQPGDTVLGMNLDHGGHLTHGSPVNFSGKYFNIVSYGVDELTGRIDYDALEKLAREYKPRMIVAGASAYPRVIDFKRCREIADEVGAWLWVDMAHIAGLVAAGLHPSPVPYAHVTSTTTHKTLRGPRGGMLLTNDGDIAKKLNSAIFPGSQGGPLMHIIAAKAVALGEALKPEFKEYQRQVVKNAYLPGDEVGVRRHRQPPGPHRPAGYGRPHRQGAGAPAGRGAHHRQQEQGPRRPPLPLPDQRPSGGQPRGHQPGFRGGRYGPCGPVYRLGGRRLRGKGR